MWKGSSPLPEEQRCVNSTVCAWRLSRSAKRNYGGREAFPQSSVLNKVGRKVLTRSFAACSSSKKQSPLLSLPVSLVLKFKEAGGAASINLCTLLLAYAQTTKVLALLPSKALGRRDEENAEPESVRSLGRSQTPACVIPVHNWLGLRTINTTVLLPTGIFPPRCTDGNEKNLMGKSVPQAFARVRCARVQIRSKKL